MKRGGGNMRKGAVCPSYIIYQKVFILESLSLDTLENAVSTVPFPSTAYNFNAYSR